MNSYVLIVDDDALLVKSLSYLLRQEGYEVGAVLTGDEALETVRRGPPDLIVLDVGLPDLNGVEVCRRLRSTWHGPIIMLTGRRHDVDKVVGLDAGADDYVVKPFVTSELLARVRAVLRRSGQVSGARNGSGEIVVGAIRIDTGARKVWNDDHPVSLSAREYDLLFLLAQRAGTAVTRQYILDRIWGPDFVGDLGALDVYIRALRKKIEVDPDQPRYIRTLRGVGYRFEVAEDGA